MPNFFFHPITIALLAGTVITGLIGILFVLPLYFIHMAWNGILANYFYLPFINVFEAFLLYIVLAIAIYLGVKPLNLKFDEDLFL